MANRKVFGTEHSRENRIERALQRYVDPEQARKVWDEYQKDLEKHGCEEAARSLLEGLAEESSDAGSLDAQLDLLMSRHRNPPVAPPPVPPDETDDTLYNNAYKAFEDREEG